jgi:hypothetical protein
MFLMGSPCDTLAPARRAFQLQTAAAVCHQKTRRPSSRVPPSVQGGRLPSFFFYRKKKEAKKKAPFGKAFRPLRRATKGAAFGNCKPLKRLDRNFTGLAHIRGMCYSILRLQDNKSGGFI